MPLGLEILPPLISSWDSPNDFVKCKDFSTDTALFVAGNFEMHYQTSS